MPSLIAEKAKLAAEAKFKKYVNGDFDAFGRLVKKAWATARPMFMAHDSPNDAGVFNFYVSAKYHFNVTVEHVRDALGTVDELKDDLLHVQICKQKGDDGEPMFEIGLVYGNVRDKHYATLIEKHRAKKQRTEAPAQAAPAKNHVPEWVDATDDEADREWAIEREIMEEAADAEAGALNDMLTDAEEEAETEASPERTLSGFPDDGNPANAEFVELLKAGKLRLKRVDRLGHAQDQAIEPGPKGRKSDVFEHKELFKQCTPRFFFNGEAKEWRRTAPGGWTGQPPAAA